MKTISQIDHWGISETYEIEAELCFINIFSSFINSKRQDRTSMTPNLETCEEWLRAQGWFWRWRKEGAKCMYSSGTGYYLLPTPGSVYTWN